MSWYEEDTLMIPKLHKCHHCKKRLSNPVIAEWGFFLGSDADVRYYCSKDCAAKENKLKKEMEEHKLKLNKEIWGME